MSTIFLDRDGAISENRPDYVKSWHEFRFLPGSKEAIAQLTRAGHRMIVCTNQACIARGIISVETVEDIHRRMLVEIAQAGGRIEKVYYYTSTAIATASPPPRHSVARPRPPPRRRNS